MTTNRTQRKLIAVVHADVKDYSRLMGKDDEYTVRTLASNRQEMCRLVALHGGHVRDTAGDGFLVEFQSVVDAIRFAVTFQGEMKERNADIPQDRKMEFRIGVNIGDVIHDGDTIYGDGVNIAARLEGLADPGGICLSGSAYEQVKKRMDVGFEYFGEKPVKNIEEPVPTYKVVLESGDPPTKGKKLLRAGWRGRWNKTFLSVSGVVLAVLAAAVIWYFFFQTIPPKSKVPSEDPPAWPLPDKPSIAVLPFVNMSGDPGQEYFSDGITEEIITGLSKVPRLFVIARNSSFNFKGKTGIVRDVGRKLGVRYVLKGSVRKEGNRARITVQLINAQSGGHLWAERYDRKLEDIFALQDEITRGIMTALQVKLTQGEQARLRNEKDRTASFAAFTKFLRALEYRNLNTKQDNLMAQQLLREAIALDPAFARAYACLAMCKHQAVVLGWSRSPVADMRKALQLSTKAIELNKGVDSAHIARGLVYLAMRQHDKAIAEGERAVELSPSGADAHFTLGTFLKFAGRPREALALMHKAIRLNPMPRSIYYYILGTLYRDMNQYDKGIAALKKCLEIDPDSSFCWINLTAAYSMAGQEDMAREAASETLKRNPNFSLEYFAKQIPFKDQASTKRVVDALRKAGLE